MAVPERMSRAERLAIDSEAPVMETSAGRLPSSEDVLDESARPEPNRPSAMPRIPERPVLAPNVELVGELRGTGFEDRQWLVQRDGRFIQLTELFYRIAEQV